MTRCSKAGFTLVETMVVVAIVAVLATVAGMTYIRHIKSARVVGARQFISQIHARQAAYLQEHGQYCNASGQITDIGAAFQPHLTTGEPLSKPWEPHVWPTATPYGPREGWGQLGVRPEDGRTYAAVYVRASIPNADEKLDHKLMGRAGDAAMGIPAQPDALKYPDATKHAWFYVIAHMDLNSSATYSNGGCTGTDALAPTDCTILWSSNANAKVMVRNEGE